MSALDDLLHDYSVYQTLPASVEDARNELAQLREELAQARSLIGRFANQGVPQAMSWMKDRSESEK